MACVLYDCSCKKCEWESLEISSVHQCPKCGSYTHIIREWDEANDHHDE